MVPADVLHLVHLVDDFTMVLLDDDKSGELLTVEGGEAGCLLDDIDVDVTLLPVSGLQGLERMRRGSRVDVGQLLNLGKGISAKVRPLDLSGSDQDLSFLGSNPVTHVRVLADTSALVGIVSDDLEQSLESLDHSDDELTEPLLAILVNLEFTLVGGVCIQVN